MHQSSASFIINYLSYLLDLGLLDVETVHMMNTPRCGNRDRNGHPEHARRRKRYALQGG